MACIVNHSKLFHDEIIKQISFSSNTVNKNAGILQ